MWRPQALAPAGDLWSETNSLKRISEQWRCWGSRSDFFPSHPNPEVWRAREGKGNDAHTDCRLLPCWRLQVSQRYAHTPILSMQSNWCVEQLTSEWWQCHQESEAASSGSVISTVGFITNKGKKSLLTRRWQFCLAKGEYILQFLRYTLWVHLIRTILQCFVTPFRRNQEIATQCSIQE